MTNFKLTPLHYAISVQDLDESINWYNNILGFTLIDKTYVEPAHSQCATMRNGSFEMEIFRHDDTRPMTEARLDPDKNPQDQGPQHICFRVDDLDGFIEEVKSKGVKILIGPVMMGTTKLYYIADNNGIPIELMN